MKKGGSQFDTCKLDKPGVSFPEKQQLESTERLQNLERQDIILVKSLEDHEDKCPKWSIESIEYNHQCLIGHVRLLQAIVLSFSDYELSCSSTNNPKS